MYFTAIGILLPLLMMQSVALDYPWIQKSLRDGLTAEEKTFLLDVHNFYRRAITRGGIIGNGPRAANMRELTWSDELARDAQSWSANCGGPMHDPASQRGYSGQNYMGHGDRSNIFKLAMEAWADNEAPRYSYGSRNYLGSGAGHYTQIIWARTHEIGCGFSMCHGHTYGRLICNFMPTGNYDKLLLYEGSSPCTKCDPGYSFCKDNLCAKSCSGAGCRCTVDSSTCSSNGGNFDSSQCFCSCPTGKTGLNCEKTCEDKQGMWCDTRNCRPRTLFYHQAEAFCPKTCKACTGECLDYQADCKTWAEAGQCQRIPDYMNKNCPKSCKQCSDGSGGSGGCKDKHANCQSWAAAGECQKNPGYMKPNCPKSCNECSSECKDKHANCQSWAAAGECQKNPDYMKPNCQKSCNEC